MAVISKRYWRIYIDTLQVSHDGYCSLAEVELRGSLGGPDLTSPSTPATASSNYPGQEVTHLVDNSLSANWSTNSGGAQPCWAAFDLGTPQAVRQIAITSLVSFPNRAPKDFRFQYSDDGVAWSNHPTSIPPQTGWGSTGETRIFNLLTSSIGGIVTLDTGIAAQDVLVYPWDNPETLTAKAIPGPDGAWSVLVPGATPYLVVVRGPSGYQPISHGPITAVE